MLYQFPILRTEKRKLSILASHFQTLTLSWTPEKIYYRCDPEHGKVTNSMTRNGSRKDSQLEPMPTSEVTLTKWWIFISLITKRDLNYTKAIPIPPPESSVSANRLSRRIQSTAALHDLHVQAYWIIVAMIPPYPRVLKSRSPPSSVSDWKCILKLTHSLRCCNIHRKQVEEQNINKHEHHCRCNAPAR